MATNGIVKTEFISAPKKTVITKVEEIHEERTISSNGRARNEDPFPCTGPPKKKLFKEFAVEYPSIEPNVMRVRDPLPFPENLHDLIGWTDSFVDRIAIVTQKQEKVSGSTFPIGSEN